MISTQDLRAIARARLRDAQVLLRAKRFDGAFYHCGYAVELALKARICRTLKWYGFPETAQDFKGFQLLRIHDVEILLGFSGIGASESKTRGGLGGSGRVASGESLPEGRPFGSTAGSGNGKVG